MDMQVKEETGFSAIEMLLYLVIVSLITFVGFYVYNSQKSANATYTTAGKTAEASAPRVIKKIKSVSADQQASVKMIQAE